MALSRPAVRVGIVVLILLGVVFVILAIVYFTTTAGDLPSLMPGHESGSSTHHVKHGIAMLVLALLSWLGAWLLSGQLRTKTAT
jgi:hypothetical protein